MATDNKMAGKFFMIAGFIFLLGNAIAYLTNIDSFSYGLPIGIALCVIGAGLYKKDEKIAK